MSELLTDAELDLIEGTFVETGTIYRAIIELRELRKRTCAICGDSGKLDDAQAWDEGQEPSDCPYCPERLDELRAENAALRAALTGFVRAIDAHHPKFAHGPFTITRREIDAALAALASVRGDA